MNDEYGKLLEITADSKLELAKSFKELLHKELVFGQTRWLCRYGTLSDGHGKLTDAQRYYQALKEMWVLRQNINSEKIRAKRNKAKLLQAKLALKCATNEPDTLLAEADLEEAQEAIISSLITIEDQMRMVDEYNRVRLELQDKVRAQYPEGIEQAERDSWLAIGQFQAIKQERLDNVPLDPITKAQLGQRFGRMDAILPLMIAEQDILNTLEDKQDTGAFIQKVIDSKTEELKELDWDKAL